MCINKMQLKMKGLQGWVWNNQSLVVSAWLKRDAIGRVNGGTMSTRLFVYGTVGRVYLWFLILQRY